MFIPRGNCTNPNNRSIVSMILFKAKAGSRPNVPITPVSTKKKMVLIIVINVNSFQCNGKIMYTLMSLHI